MDYKFDIALSFASEDQDFVDSIYHYLRAKGVSAFFAPSPEGQAFLSGQNQREAFYRIFGVEAQYVALFVSKYYVARKVPMEEAGIAFVEHEDSGSVIPIYMDGTSLPIKMFDPHRMNYFRSDNAAEIAKHLAEKIKTGKVLREQSSESENSKNQMVIKGNTAEKTNYMQIVNGNVNLRF